MKKGIILLPKKYHHYDPDSTSPDNTILPRWWPKLYSGMRHCVATLATRGNNIVVDDVLLKKEDVYEYLNVLQGFPVVFIGVYCSLDELERREQARGDREAGLAGYQFERVHTLCQYDIEIDTSKRSPQECALRIKLFLEQGKQPTAFD